MPDTMSRERINILKAYGAEVVLTDGALAMTGAVEKAEELARQHPGSFIPLQFENPANAQAHRQTTGPEIWEDTGGNVDIFIAGVGTGGTLTGAGEYLKSKNPDLKVIAVEPASSPMLSQGKSGPHKIQGIGANFIPKLLNTEIYDEVFPVDDEAGFVIGRELAKSEGFLAGISSGAALYAASKWQSVRKTGKTDCSHSAGQRGQVLFHASFRRMTENAFLQKPGCRGQKMQKIRDGCGTMKRAAAYGIYIWHIEERNIILQQSGGIFMSEKTAEIVKNIIDSYRKHTLTTQIDKVSQPNREIVVDVLESIRKLVFPGFFEVKNLKSEYIEYYVGELIEDIRYHLKKTDDESLSVLRSRYLRIRGGDRGTGRSQM